MTRRNRHLLLQFAIAIGVCAVIAVFDQVLVGLIGAGVCTIIFAARMFFPSSGQGPWNAEQSEPAAATDRDHVVYGHAPHCYTPGNPIYYPPDNRDYPHGR